MTQGWQWDMSFTSRTLDIILPRFVMAEYHCYLAAVLNDLIPSNHFPIHRTNASITFDVSVGILDILAEG